MFAHDRRSLDLLASAIADERCHARVRTDREIAQQIEGDDRHGNVGSMRQQVTVHGRQVYACPRRTVRPVDAREVRLWRHARHTVTALGIRRRVRARIRCRQPLYLRLVFDHMVDERIIPCWVVVGGKSAVHPPDTVSIRVALDAWEHDHDAVGAVHVHSVETHSS